MSFTRQDARAAEIGIVLLTLLLTAFAGCGGGGNYPVIGVPSGDAVSVTPSAAHIGLRKFEGKLIAVRMDYKKEMEPDEPLTRKLIFRGEEREFAMILPKGKYDDAVGKLKPGQTCRIYGVLRAAGEDKYIKVEIR